MSSFIRNPYPQRTNSYFLWSFSSLWVLPINLPNHHYCYCFSCYSAPINRLDQVTFRFVCSLAGRDQFVDFLVESLSRINLYPTLLQPVNRCLFSIQEHLFGVWSSLQGLPDVGELRRFGFERMGYKGQLLTQAFIFRHWLVHMDYKHFLLWVSQHFWVHKGYLQAHSFIFYWVHMDY